jgi:hypothetical protein
MTTTFPITQVPAANSHHSFLSGTTCEGGPDWLAVGGRERFERQILAGYHGMEEELVVPQVMQQIFMVWFRERARQKAPRRFDICS